MGRKSNSGGVLSLGRNRIQFDLTLERRRYRPSLPWVPTEANLRRAALHRDWGEAQGNYDEFRFFTGLRPSEQIALAVTDYDAAHGVLSVTKARVGGLDKDVTKTGEDRRITLCPRAIAILKRQLSLRQRLVEAGQIEHSQLFFDTTGKPFRRVAVPYRRWRQTLRRLPIRYRKPYAARHTSVSWALMTGSRPLRVAKQRGHSISTMLWVYAAWAEGASESDAVAIRDAMNATVSAPPAVDDDVTPTQWQPAVSASELDLPSAMRPSGGICQHNCQQHRRSPCVSHGKYYGNGWRRGWDSHWHVSH